ncbi:tRNA glutamyl-Q(34) synthetase GluQRS [Sulfitobacter geojensis]|uniref:tRNA glutamyl-Q(34) synthetase GluQRS n=1 Tax=Sulfitobacter geojensis TaxID=1342299 RepID=A0AAE2VVW5_9RHOB|nr:tRNA glutamyl-Q(34) synthetase GluQRS [Sulfitobacter geojensis]MBM1692447.1 tRNA glutamyl-Q(34) synthetase GluQRS [Sulfitobacter geojensis]MBM1704613.1 tRNA glutamyl-Q(34) synthetase GluQRS [Sulfitobacter geojensis]MBM1708671.1 tRNA glutamyl-Q(34) synthetase GluQRS [Sulfitobacter geojensis]MBM1712736.1 tRNA glutamyl-Q(34) synthetase GluQRS [Sulfitobacter geojensis]
MTFRTRFAPSPTGPLHLGHAYSAMLAHDMAVAQGGEFLLRIEDIDQSRARAVWEAQIYDDLKWLGLTWPEPVMRQSDRLGTYGATLDRLWENNQIYPCRCSRADINAALSAPQEGVPTHGPDGLIYPGTCRPRETRPTTERPQGNVVLRLNIAAAVQDPDRIFQFQETGSGPHGETGLISFTGQDVITEVGDIVIARRDMGTSYHLAVVLDDAAQGISHVVRGADLFEATKIHVVLQNLLGLPVPIYHHHRLIRDEAGKRLAKRDDAKALSLLRESGLTAEDIRALLAL